MATTKEDLLKGYEKDRDSVIAKHREEFLELEKRLEGALCELRGVFLKELDKLEKVGRVIASLPEKVVEEVREVKETKEVEESNVIPVKRKNAWNINKKG